MKSSFKKFKKSTTSFLDVTLWALRNFYELSKVQTLTYFIASIIRELRPLYRAFMLGYFVDALTAVAAGSLLLPDFAKGAALVVAGLTVFSFAAYLAGRSRRYFRNHFGWFYREKLINYVASLGLGKLEDPDINNRIDRYRGARDYMSGHVYMLGDGVSAFFSALSSAVAVVFILPWLVLAFAAVSLWDSFVSQTYIRRLWVFDRDNTEKSRINSNDVMYLTDPRYLKEIVISGGYSYLMSRYQKFSSWYASSRWSIWLDWDKWLIGFRFIDAFLYFVMFIVLGRRVAEGTISVGDFTFYFSAMLAFYNGLGNAVNLLVNIQENAVKLEDAYELINKYKPEVDGTEVIPQVDNPLEIDIRNITFSYPNSDVEVLKNLNLKIEPGEKIALVGENGAGKTTLIKLIARLYRVDSGEIVVGGENINDVQIATWYQNIGVLFQDYNQYDNMSVRENIVIGSRKKKHTDEEIFNAAELATAAPFIAKYKNKLDQMLGERFEGGIRPSTGQWQKIAIARFFYRDAPILILDEPTAAIDALAEAEIFDNIYKFVKNKTVIIVSHRFSTVRNADRILVLDNVKIVEDGTHEELLALGGKYAKSFTTQAKGYV